MCKTLYIAHLPLILALLTPASAGAPVNSRFMQRDWRNWSVFVAARRHLIEEGIDTVTARNERHAGPAASRVGGRKGKAGGDAWDDAVGEFALQADRLAPPSSTAEGARTVEAMLRFAEEVGPAAPNAHRGDLLSIIRFVGVGHGKSREDAIKKNGRIFVDWPTPAAAIVFSGEMNGYLEPCGCAGLENQKGGLMRRHTLLEELAERGWPLLAVDLGGQVRRLGRQPKLKFDYAVATLASMGYAAVGFGPMDLKMDPLSAAINFESGNPFVAANVALVSYDSGFSERLKVIEVGMKRVGITAILGAGEQAQLENLEDIVLDDPVAALREVLPQLRKERCDILVLLSHAEPDESRALAREFPEFDLVVTAGGASEPPFALEKIEGTKARLVEVGQKGMYTSVVAFYDDGQKPQRYQRVPLDHRFADSSLVREALVRYQRDLEAMGLEWLAKGATHPSGDRHFVGSEACADCHTEAWAVFEESPHFHATDTLVALDPPRHFDPECLSCHATGWNAQKFFPYDTGFASLEKTAHLTANGCENCHGPASAHVQAEEEGASEAELEKRREELRLRVVPNEGNQQGQVVGRVVRNCLECHDLDNSPDFDFQEYWAEERGVRHSGVD